jgi:predicted O-linked N-acetylglucosamine transferase (SPINDLY family)
MTEEPLPNAFQLPGCEQLTLGGLIETAAGLSNAGQASTARQLYQAWIERNPNHPQLYVAHFNCAALAGQMQDQAAAAASLSEAIRLNPDFAPAYINLGRIHEQAGATAQAVELWRTALSRPAPVNASAIQYATTALTQIARVMSASQQGGAAEDAVRQCLEINPRQPDIIEQYTALRLAQCKWPIAISSEFLDRKVLLEGTNPLSMAVYTDDPLLQLASAYRYVKRSSWDGQHDGQNDRRHAEIDLSGRRPRIGYISSDLRDHAIGYLMAELFELHDKRGVEIFAYYCGPKSNSALTNRIKSAVEHWVDIRDLSDEEAARRIAGDGIDILVDVNGHTCDSRTGVFARRPAPIQVNWLGYPGSLGTPYHHYLIADDWIVPPESEIYYSEKIVRLPCYQSNDRKRIIAPECPTRSAAGLPESGFVFCCFNGSHKISKFTFERWLEILARTKDSVLWLLDTSEQTKTRLQDVAAQKGISPSRLVFAPKLRNDHHLARYPLADLFLDTTPYGAHTTASDALWMGVPVLTLSGRCFASRVCGSLVRSAGLPDLVTTSPEDYVARAIALAADPDAIAAYKTALRANRDTCQLFNTDSLVAHLENLYRSLCDAHSKGLTPQPDLANLDAYFDAGIDHDHDGQEVIKIADYHGMYRAKLKRIHLARPLHQDSRLWGESDIAAAEAPKPAQGASNGGQEQTLERLKTLLALKARGVRPEVLLEAVRVVIDPATQCFNQLVAAGNIGQAVLYADALADLLPGNRAALNSALSCNNALGRQDRSAQLAALLAATQPALTPTPAAVNASSPAAPPPAAPAAPAAQEETHPLIQLRDLYDEASSILCGSLDDHGAKQIGRLRTTARKLEVPVPKDSDWAGWEKHYRLVLQAIDVSDVSKPTPKPSNGGKIALADSSGKKLDWGRVQAAANKLQAKAVFFAAADKAYVELYGRSYIESILEHSDVSSLIVLHVIGGAKQLRDIVKGVGISSNRLFFTADTFDADSIKTRCFDAPPKGLSKLPIAHFQSVRFLRVGTLLQKLQLPVFVSDIDLILQRGVSDLMREFGNSDIVLNENRQSVNAGSRYTANLLLLNPTESAAIFVRFLRAYLEKALNAREVSRWIDQFGLMMARHHLMQRRPDALIGYFDVNSDINNVMYTKYQEHPYRFLSLYHGFDMSTLPQRSKARAVRVSGRSKRTVSRGPSLVSAARAGGRR